MRVDISQPLPLLELPTPPRTPLRFLKPGAPPAQFIRATAENHVQWFARGAVRFTLSPPGQDSITWICTPDDITIPFPRLSPTFANQALDRVIADCRSRAPKQIGFWALNSATST